MRSLANCFDVKLTTKSYGWENSWALGTCSNNQAYTSGKEYTEKCCLAPGVYTLECKDSYGDGWHGGYIEIQGTQYCADFSGGSEHATQVTIVAGKYRFMQGCIYESLNLVLKCVFGA